MFKLMVLLPIGIICWSSAILFLYAVCGGIIVSIKRKIKNKHNPRY